MDFPRVVDQVEPVLGGLLLPALCRLGLDVCRGVWLALDSYATRAYRGSRNLRAVQMLLAHASIATTEQYTAVDDAEISEATVAAIAE
jgi:hypothetical protein